MQTDSKFGEVLAEGIAIALSKNVSLRTLSVVGLYMLFFGNEHLGNCMGPNGARNIMRSLIRNNTLTHLNISCELHCH